MDNKKLAEELITRYAGIPHPMRGLIQEAARRLLQMVPDVKIMAGTMEAKCLRELAAEWPLKDKPWMTPDWTADDWLRCACTGAADRIEQMAETIAYARKIQAERDSMAATLKKIYGCGGCAHCNCDFDQEPCNSCRKDGNFPKWVWKGENHG